MPTPTPLPTKVVEFGKTVVATTADTTRAVADTVATGAERAWTTLHATGSTVVGQARSVVGRTAVDAAAGMRGLADQTRSVTEQTASDAVAGAREIAGQASAQGAKASERLGAIANDTVLASTAAVQAKPGRGVAYEDWSKADLYERAQDLGIEGRSTMSKQELIAALRS